MRIAVLQHVAFEGPGAIANWAEQRGHSLTCYLAEAGFPALDSFDMLAVMGGPMGVYDGDTIAWIETEKRFLVDVIAANKPVIGFCLGAQMLAAVLGAKVYKGDAGREIGYFPIAADSAAERLGLPAASSALHWHGDTFDIPEGAQRLFSSQAYSNQGFIYKDKIIALQFHWEIMTAGVEALLEHCAEELDLSDWVQTPEQVRNGRHDGEGVLYAILDYLLARVRS